MSGSYESWCVHVIVACEDCDWESGDFLTGREKAAEHARKHKHKVRGEAGYAIVYDHREGEKK